MDKHKYKKGAKLFILDMQYGRVFPVIVEKLLTEKDLEGKFINRFCKVDSSLYRSCCYKVTLDVTPGVHDRLAFNGIAKPIPFDIYEDDVFTENNLFEDALQAYQTLSKRFEQESESLKHRLEDLKWLKTAVTKRLNQTAKVAGLVYKIGDLVWYLDKDYHTGWQIKSGKIVEYDRGDFEKPYKLDTGDWPMADTLYPTREAAAEALKLILKQEYAEKLKAIS